MQYGPEALKSLNADPSFAYQPPAPVTPTPSQGAMDIYNSYQAGQQNVPDSSKGGQGIGESGLDRMAADQGISFEEARRRAESAGMVIGERARNR